MSMPDRNLATPQTASTSTTKPASVSTPSSTMDPSASRSTREVVDEEAAKAWLGIMPPEGWTEQAEDGAKSAEEG